MAKTDIPKAYESGEYEDDIYAAWETSGFFNPDHLPGERTEPFTIVLPPPNVTGTLHLGHAVMLAIEDIMIRFARLRGKAALWIPGTDHAGIATQTKVEKMLIESGLKDPRRELGREAFLAHVEKFARESHDTIVGQAKKMGASLDWSREAYTLDEARNVAVNKVFKMMYEDGLIYRGDRIVNWCPRCKSTIADDEVEYKEEKTKFYYFKYGPVVIGTARPETKFLDKVIIVHPKDERYKDLAGKEFEMEWIGGKIKARMIADEAADMEMGSGAMTITPAHSFVDFDLAKKYDLEIVKIIDEDGNFTDAAGEFAGKFARSSREEIVKMLEEKGLVDHIDEDYVHNLSVCYRCDTPIEPLPKLQWFIDVNKPFYFRASEHAPIEGVKDAEEVTLKKLMQHVVRSEQIEIIPDRFNKTYFAWIDHLRDWCISRQLWFGHRIPVWYRGEEMAVGEAPEGEGWVQDPDTLDTWFSSGLWTFSTLGWPYQTDDLKRYHPTSVLETGYDIIFFWVARMILMTTYAVGEIPFKQVYLHGLVRDEQGRKMSKSLDNIIDPLDMITEFGADATRLSLVIGSSPGNDTKLSKAKIAGYRNFTNKLWNISRFILSSVDAVSPSYQGGVRGGPEAETLADKWILSRFGSLVRDVTQHLENHEFSPAGEKLRDFTWNEFADWYLEIAKVQKNQESGIRNQGSTDAILLFILENLLVLWHPFMPFVTEQIWKEFSNIPPLTKGGLGGVSDADMLIVHAWPNAPGERDVQAEAAFDLVKDVIVAIRNVRAEYNVAPSQEISAILTGAHLDVLEAEKDAIHRLARVEHLTIETDAQKPEGAASAIVGDVTVYIPLEGLVDLEKEKSRLEKEIASTKKYLDGLRAKLANEEFTSKAPAHIVDDMKQKQRDAEKTLEALETQRASL